MADRGNVAPSLCALFRRIARFHFIRGRLLLAQKGAEALGAPKPVLNGNRRDTARLSGLVYCMTSSGAESSRRITSKVT